MSSSEGVRRYLEEYLQETLRSAGRLPLDQVVRVVEILEEANREGRHVFICGNGGSAATASHLANDLGKGACVTRKRRFRVLALTDNIPWITALANDLDYSQIFVEQLRNFADPGDVLMAFSGSGASKNVLEAVQWARDHGLTTVGFCSSRGGPLSEMAEHAVVVESSHMGQIEDCHFLLQHLIGYYFMENAEPELPASGS
ncbi:MAG: SIS domain-containing protein [Acidobacteriota bacterium]